MASQVAPARGVAFDLLVELRQRPSSRSDELLQSKKVQVLSAADRNLCMTLVMGVLRWQLLLEQRVQSERKNKGRLAQPVQVALALGAFQLLLLDRIPAHAAIFDSVELTKRSGNFYAAGLVNAVLRKLVDSPHIEATAEVCMAAHPQWMVERWAEAYGLETAGAICRSNQSPPPITVRLLDPDAETALEAEGVQLAQGAFVERARRVIQGDVAATRTLAQGLIRIQDEGSQLIAELAGAGSAILDCCAAPGGKTAILAERNPGASITACDSSSARLQAMQRLLHGRPGMEGISLHLLDARNLPFERQFDLVLCDAPCSGTGTLARNPEIRHRLTPGDLGRQRDRQVKLLLSAMKALAPGGKLLYSTCSLEEEENEQVIAAALEGKQEFRLESWPDRVRRLEAEGVLLAGTAVRLFAENSPGGFLRTVPGIHPCDGFFGALITREK